VVEDGEFCSERGETSWFGHEDESSRDILQTSDEVELRTTRLEEEEVGEEGFWETVTGEGCTGEVVCVVRGGKGGSEEVRGGVRGGRKRGDGMRRESARSLVLGTASLELGG
jgi:hypothetical protein